MTCKCYHAEKNYLGKIGVCWGTKECDPCSCDGDETKCDFYEKVHQRVQKPQVNADMKKDICSFCGKKIIYAKGLCRSCYDRNRRNGSPEYLDRTKIKNFMKKQTKK